MDTNTEVFELAQATTADRARVGGKAGVLGELAAAGFPIPPGLVVTAGAFNVDGWQRHAHTAGTHRHGAKHKANDRAECTDGGDRGEPQRPLSPQLTATTASVLGQGS